MQLDLFNDILTTPQDKILVTALQDELPNTPVDKILFTGVGKINAAHALTRYLERHPDVRTVINYGTAGAAFGVTKGELIKCTTFVQGDMDCSLITEGPGVTYGDKDVFSNVLEFGTDGAICRTQDQFVTDLDALDLFQHLLEGRKFNCVDMEAYALAKVCVMMDRDFVCYKYISDDADEASDEEWEENVYKGEPLILNKLLDYGFKKYDSSTVKISNR